MSRELIIQSVLTQGGQSTVYQGLFNNHKVAIKVYEEQQVCKDEYDILQLIDQVPGLITMKIPEIIQIKYTDVCNVTHGHHDKFSGDNPVGSALVFDLLDDDLYQFALSKKKSLSIDNIQQLAIQLLNTLVHLNKLGITHNDIKPENIMIEDNQHTTGPKRELIISNPRFKLIDFAYASKDCIIAGTSTYYSPEQLANQGGVMRQFGNIPRSILDVNQKVDVWAFGCVLVEMYSGLRLFDFTNDTRRFAGIYAILSVIEPLELNEQVVDKINKYLAERMQTPKDQKLIKQAITVLSNIKNREPILYDLVVNMLKFNPKQRYSNQQCLDHQFTR